MAQEEHMEEFKPGNQPEVDTEIEIEEQEQEQYVSNGEKVNFE